MYTVTGLSNIGPTPKTAFPFTRTQPKRTVAKNATVGNLSLVAFFATSQIFYYLHMATTQVISRPKDKNPQ